MKVVHSFGVVCLCVVSLIMTACQSQEEKVASLIEKLKHEKASARINAIEQLERIDDPSVVPALCEVLKDTDGDVQGVAIRALGRIGDPVAVPALSEALEDTELNLFLRKRMLP